MTNPSKASTVATFLTLVSLFATLAPLSATTVVRVFVLAALTTASIAVVRHHIETYRALSRDGPPGP